VTSLAELAHGEKSHTQSITHPAYLMTKAVLTSIKLASNRQKSILFVIF